MIFDPKIYYQAFPADYHKFKVISLKKILENIEKYEVEFFDHKFGKDQSKKFELTLRSETVSQSNKKKKKAKQQSIIV